MLKLSFTINGMQWSGPVRPLFESRIQRAGARQGFRIDRDDGVYCGTALVIRSDAVEEICCDEAPAREMPCFHRFVNFRNSELLNLKPPRYAPLSTASF